MGKMVRDVDDDDVRDETKTSR